MNLHSDNQGFAVGNYPWERQCGGQDQLCFVWDALQQLWDNTPEDKMVQDLTKAMNNGRASDSPNRSGLP